MNDPVSAVVVLGMELRAAIRRHTATRDGGGPGDGGGRRRWMLPAATLVVVAVGLAGAGWALTRATPEDDRVLVRGGDGSISLLDPATGASLFEVPDAVATPDRSALLTTRPSGRDTVLESRDPTTGSVTGSTTLTGELNVRTVSPTGSAVALMPGAAGDGIYDPLPRTTTDLTVAFVDDREPLQFSLDGNIEPEMFSLDDSTLFVLEFVPPSEPTGYYVKKLDLATGEMTDTDGQEVELEPDSAMRGRARAQAMHPDGTFLYTLYTLPHDAPVHEGEPSAASERWAFVHVISLEEKWSLCVFLPVPFGTEDEAALGMAVAPDGHSLLVADPSVSQVAEIDTASHTVADVHEVERLRPTGDRAQVAIAGDGTAYVSVGTLVLELEAGTFEPLHAWSQDTVVTGLSVAGDELRVGGDGGVSLVDRATRRETGAITSPDRGTLELLGPPRGSVTEFPIECAC